MFEHAFKVRMLFIHHGNKKDPGDSPGLAVLPDAFSAHLYAGGGADDNDGGVRHPHRRNSLPSEIEISRRVEQIDLRIQVLGKRRRHLNRDVVGMLLRRMHGEGGPIVDTSVALGRARNPTKSVNQTRLPGPAMPQHGNVPDAVRGVFLTGCHSQSSRIFR